MINDSIDSSSVYFDKLDPEKADQNDLNENKMKILVNKLQISKIAIDLSFKPSFEMLRALTSSQK